MPANEEINVSSVTVETINNQYLNMFINIVHEGKNIEVRIDKDNKYQMNGAEGLIEVTKKFDETGDVDLSLMGLKAKLEIYNSLIFTISNVVIPYAYKGKGG